MQPLTRKQQEQMNQALLMAIAERSAREAREAIEQGADPNAKGEHGWTPLMSAAFMCDEKLCKLLLERGAAVDGKANDGTTALMVAALMNEAKVARLLLERGAKVDATDKRGYNALLISAEGGGASVLGELLEAGADVEAKRDGKSLVDIALAADQSGAKPKDPEGHRKVVSLIEARALAQAVSGAPQEARRLARNPF